jgi:hypothetical protein
MTGEGGRADRLAGSGSRLFTRMETPPSIEKLLPGFSVFWVGYAGYRFTYFSTAWRLISPHAFSAPVGIDCVPTTYRPIGAFRPAVPAQPRHGSALRNNDLVGHSAGFPF